MRRRKGGREGGRHISRERIGETRETERRMSKTRRTRGDRASEGRRRKGGARESGQKRNKDGVRENNRG